MNYLKGIFRKDPSLAVVLCGGGGVDGGFSVGKINHLPAPFCHQPLDSLYKAFQYSSKNDGSRSRLNHN